MSLRGTNVCLHCFSDLHSSLVCFRVPLTRSAQALILEIVVQLLPPYCFPQQLSFKLKACCGNFMHQTYGPVRLDDFHGSGMFVYVLQRRPSLQESQKRSCPPSKLFLRDSLAGHSSRSCHLTSSNTKQIARNCRLVWIASKNPRLCLRCSLQHSL